MEIKSTDFKNKNTLNDPDKNKHKFVQEVFEKCIDDSDCYYAAVIIENEDIELYFPRERLSKHYILLLQRIQETAKRNYCDNVIVLIDNENRKIDKYVAYAFNNYLYRTARGNDLDRILEVPIFADSEMTIGLQLADLVAGVLRQYYSKNLDEIDPNMDESLYIQKLREYYAIILNRVFPNFYGIRGLYKAPENFLSNYYTKDF